MNEYAQRAMNQIKSIRFIRQIQKYMRQKKSGPGKFEAPIQKDNGPGIILS